MNRLRVLIAGLGAALIIGAALPQLLLAEDEWGGEGVEARIGRALACYGNGDLDCAVSELEKARALKPHDAQLRFMLGNAYYRKRDWRSAITHYVEAGRLRPDHPDTYLNLGFAYYHGAELASAAAAWEIAVKRSPRDPLARMALAVGLFGLGQPEDALTQLSLALDLRPDSCDKAQLATDVRWQADALAQVERLCKLVRQRQCDHPS